MLLCTVYILLLVYACELGVGILLCHLHFCLPNTSYCVDEFLPSYSTYNMVTGHGTGRNFWVSRTGLFSTIPHDCCPLPLLLGVKGSRRQTAYGMVFGRLAALHACLPTQHEQQTLGATIFSIQLSIHCFTVSPICVVVCLVPFHLPCGLPTLAYSSPRMNILLLPHYQAVGKLMQTIYTCCPILSCCCVFVVS